MFDKGYLFAEVLGWFGVFLCDIRSLSLHNTVSAENAQNCGRCIFPFLGTRKYFSYIQSKIIPAIYIVKKGQYPRAGYQIQL